MHKLSLSRQPSSLAGQSVATPAKCVTVLGAGAAGSMLALELIELGYQGEIHLYDQRSRFDREQRWCFWGEPQGVLAGATRRSWAEWEVVSSHGRRRHCQAKLAYQEIHAPDFFLWAHDHLRQQPNVRFHLGQAVERPSPNSVLSSDRAVVDCTGYHDSATPVFWQSFLGWEISVERDLFEANRATIMDHRAQGPGIAFGYVLPYSSRRAFIELTCFHERKFSGAELERELQTYIETHFGSVSEVHSVEQGCLPMGVETARNILRPNHFQIGGGAGALRASSGYGFLAICNQARSLAHALCFPGGQVWQRRDKYAHLDKLFLHVLKKEPARAAELFDCMFGRVPSTTLVRFLQDKSSFADDLRIISSLPKVPFLKALFSHAR